jgi:hypothetical protein
MADKIGEERGGGNKLLDCFTQFTFLMDPTKNHTISEIGLGESTHTLVPCWMPMDAYALVSKEPVYGLVRPSPLKSKSLRVIGNNKKLTI